MSHCTECGKEMPALEASYYENCQGCRRVGRSWKVRQFYGSLKDVDLPAGRAFIGNSVARGKPTDTRFESEPPVLRGGEIIRDVRLEDIDSAPKRASTVRTEKSGRRPRGDRTASFYIRRLRGTEAGKLCLQEEGFISG